jgi:hypothetical protein
VADSWCWFVLREEYCWLVADGWFVLREKYCWLVDDKPSEQPVCSFSSLGLVGTFYRVQVLTRARLLPYFFSLIIYQNTPYSVDAWCGRVVDGIWHGVLFLSLVIHV